MSNFNTNFQLLGNDTNESFEAYEKMCEKTASDPNSTLFRYLQEERESKCSPLRNTNDDTFEMLEKMCDKTASDPNSTLFHYLHSDRKDEVIAAKKRSGNCATMCVNDTGNTSHITGNFSDCTLLDDVEAPSRLWENTVTIDSGFRTSPIKMVGLMRPSTILEEPVNESTNSDISSQISFRTASTKAPLSDISSAYDTARESTENTEKTLLNQTNKEIEIDVDDIIMKAIEKARVSTIPPYELKESEGQTRADVNIHGDLIDLEKTLGNQEDLANNIIVIDDEEKENECDLEKSTSINDDSSIIDILSDEEMCISSKFADVKLECTTVDQLDNNVEGSQEETLEEFPFDLSEQCVKFNDTMEEVEYLLKKGIEYMTANENAIAQNKENEKSKSNYNSPVLNSKQNKPNVNPHQKAKLHSSHTFNKTPQTCMSQRSEFDMRPFPKLDIFGKPQGNASHPRQKELNSKDQFAHIVSPIGTYMNKTSTTPLMSTGRMKRNNRNVLDSSAFRELEYESRLCEPKIVSTSIVQRNQQQSGLQALPGCVGIQKILPKKAYISSDLKHITDERTPFTIPGGKKIQKYLESAMMPAVLRHDGKMKIAESTCGKTTVDPSSKLYNESASTSSSIHRKNASIADLSLMSGDVSMYTIMDAQKF
ncbi:septin interacting protein 2 isoform X2 [Haematobia irritans]